MTIKKLFSTSHVRGGSRKPYALGLIATAVFGAAMVLPALPTWAQSGHSRHCQHEEGGAAGWRGSPERMERMLSTVNASPEQREQIKKILKNAASDQSTQREAGRALREQAMAVFTAPVIDADAAEKVRQQMLAHHDQASKRMMTTMLEVSRVLTQEQRAQLAAQMQQRGHSRMKHHAQ